jgi:hypothetical protein
MRGGTATCRRFYFAFVAAAIRRNIFARYA